MPTTREDVRIRLAEALHRMPGADARMLERDLAIPKRLINSVLYGSPAIFFMVPGSPPGWWLQERLQAAPTEMLADASVESTLSDRLYPWQSKALEAWHGAERSGIIEAVTGAGKTMVGLAAIDEAIAEGGRAAVIVPTIELLHQWTASIEGSLPAVEIGSRGDGEHGDLSTCEALVSTVNSARGKWLGLPEGVDGLLVADECHRYGAGVNKGALEEGFKSRLGLSATYARSDGAHETVLRPYFGSVVFSLGYADAIAAEVVASFRVALVGVDFDHDERSEYEHLSSEFNRCKMRLVRECGAPEEPFGELMKFIDRLKHNGSTKEKILAGRFWRALTKRRTLLAETPSKFNALVGLRESIRAADRAIVFTQTVVAAQRAAAVISAGGLSAEPLHSKMNRNERRRVLGRFAAGDLDAVVAPQLLDEGVDVPAADLGIILAASKQRRQMIQRMGRVLRLKADGRPARFAIVYVRNTSEDPKNGAHEAFLEEVLDVADEFRVFSPSASAGKIASFLDPGRS